MRAGGGAHAAAEAAAAATAPHLPVALRRRRLETGRRCRGRAGAGGGGAGGEAEEVGGAAGVDVRADGEAEIHGEEEVQLEDAELLRRDPADVGPALAAGGMGRMSTSGAGISQPLKRFSKDPLDVCSALLPDLWLHFVLSGGRFDLT